MRTFIFLLCSIVSIGIFPGTNAWASPDDARPLFLSATGEKALSADKALIEPSWLGKTVAANGLSVNVYFKDAAGQGFRDTTYGGDRQDRLYEAIAYLCDVLNETGEVDLVVEESESDGSGALAEGGPLFPPANGLTNGNAYERITSGVKPFADYSEMDLSFDWGHPWHIGKDPAPIDKVDLRSVAIHELTHCFGYVSLMKSDGGSKLAPSYANAYTHLDSLLAKSNQVYLLNTSGANPTFTASAADLISGTLIFRGSTARTAFGAAYPPIESSSPFRTGTSLQHWASGGIPAGAVMEPSYQTGVLKRTYAAVDIAALRDIGYTNAAEADLAADCPLNGISFTLPSSSTIAATGTTTSVITKTSVTFDYTDSNCIIDDDDVTVSYYVDGALRLTSDQMAQQFVVTLGLTAGTHTLKAVATRTGSGESVEAQMNITVQAVANPVLAVSPDETAFSFGELGKNEAGEMTFTVSNSGNGTLTGAALLTGDSAFALVGTANYSLNADQTSAVVVRFTPTEKGASYTGVLSFSGNNGREVRITLTGSRVGSTGLFDCAGRPQEVLWGGLNRSDGLLAAVVLLALWAGRRFRRA